MSDGKDIYTSLGLRKIRDAAGSETQVRISQIALGDGQGIAYEPAANQTGLRRELLRQDIESHYPLGNNAWFVKAVFPAGSDAITIREIGFFDEDGDMIAMWAGAGVTDDRRTGAVDYLINHILDFSAVDAGLVIIQAPIDQEFARSAADAYNFAILHLEQFRLGVRNRDLSGRY